MAVALVLWILSCATPASAAPAFPVVSSTNGRYLVDQRATPFPILGRTAWFVLSLTARDYRAFLDDTAARGYTAVEMHVINHDPRGNHPPFSGDGAKPFLKTIDGAAWSGSLGPYRAIARDAPDFTTPDEGYWRFADEFLAYAEARGILVFMFPAYVGAQGGDQGWMQEMVANGPARMRAYGAWIAARYRNQRNLVWMMGGDKGTGADPFDAAQTAVEAALLAGIQGIRDRRSIFFSAEWASEAVATDQRSFGAAMTLNGAYSWSGDVVTQARRAYAHTPPEPSFLLEEPYDEEGPDGNRVNPSATQPVRRFQWAGCLSAIGGYISGNGYVWPFRDASLRGWVRVFRAFVSGRNRTWPLRPPGWREHLDTEGSRDMRRLNEFIRSIRWYDLVPSGLGGMTRLIVSGNGSTRAADYVAAAANPRGDLLVAYVPPAHVGAIVVDAGAIKGDARARWFDPTSGTYVPAGAGDARTFTPPGKNSAGATDWVLVIQR